MSTAEEATATKSWEEIKSEMEAIASDAGKGAVERVEAFIEEREKEWRAFKELSESDKKDYASGALAEEFKAALMGAQGEAKAQAAEAAKAPGTKFARLLPFIAKGGYQNARDQQAGIEIAKAQGYDDVAKALEFSTYEAAGVLVEDEPAADFIEATYAQNVVRQLGAMTVDLSGGEVPLNKQNQTATAYWNGETEAVTVSNQTFKQKKLTPHELSVLVPISNKLMDRWPGGMENVVRNDMLSVTDNALDLAYIRGDASDDTPQGILNQTASGNKFDGTDGPTNNQVAEELLKCMYLVDVSDINVTRPGWMFHPRIKYFLMKLRTSDGFPIYQQELSSGNLFGAPVGTSTQIPITKTGDGDETEVYYGDFAQVVIGTDPNVRVSEGQHTYQDASSNTVFAFQQGITLVKLDTYTDIVVRHDDAFGIIENADWGNALG